LPALSRRENAGVPPTTDAPPVRLRISAVSGRVTVTAEDRADVVVDQGGVARTDADGAVEIRPAMPSSSIEVKCPAGADVIVGTRSGRVELSGRYGSIGVTSQSGSIRAGAAAEADLRTLSGSVELAHCDGRCRVSTKSGRIALGATGDVEISTVSGSVGLDGAAGGVQVRTVSGRVSIVSAGRGPVRAGTVSGSITIALPAGVRPAVRFSGRGTVRSSFEPGDDVLVDLANVSGTVRLVPA
jgi:DUF4097 and DUF4098 domain-containing protein YvlB